MFSTLPMNFARFSPRFRLPGIPFGFWKASSNAVDLEEMPLSLQRDLGLLEGRGPRGEAEHFRQRAFDLIGGMPRNL